MPVTPLKRPVAFFLSLLLSLSTAPTALRSEVPEPRTETSLPLSNLAVSEEVGKVQERFAGNSSRTIIQIQDVHAHAAAQQNIAAILERLRTVFGIETVALEGAWTSTSLPESHAIPTSREKQLLTGTLLEDDRISGPAYAAIMSPEPITLVGIENDALYEKNRSLFLAHLGRSKEIDTKLRSYEASLQESQRSTWGPELLAFAKAFGKFRETSSLGKFFPILLKTAEVRNTALSDLAQITLLRDTLALEKTFSKESLEREVQLVMREYKNTPWTLEELIRGGKIPSEKLGSYPEIKKLARLYQMRDQLSAWDLTIQIEALTGRVLEKLAEKPEENALWRRTERFYLARRILLLQATPSDMTDYNNEKLSLESELGEAGLLENLALSLDFYETVKKRDAIFFDKITSDPVLAGNVAVVTGGFHTEGLSQKFRDAGISYITITPELGGAPMNEKLYEERMKESQTAENKALPIKASPENLSPVSASAAEQTLSELRNAIAWIETRFLAAYEVLLRTKNLNKALAAFLGKQVPTSKTEQVARLTTEGRIRKDAETDTVSTVEFRLQEFMALSRSEQQENLRQLMERANHGEQKAMLVTSVSILGKMLRDARSEARIKEINARGDMLALVQDVPAAETPEALLSMQPGIRRFAVPDMDALLKKNPPFATLARQRPFVIMKNGYRSENRVVVDEDPIWLELFPVLTLNARLYENAKNPAFLALLKTLWTEALSRELAGKSV